MILLTDEERRELLDYPWFDKSSDEYYDIDGLLCAQLKKVVEWGNEECDGHGGYECSLYRRQCLKCWQALEKEARG